MASKSRNALDENLADIDRLLAFHSDKGGDKRGRRHKLEVLNKSAIVLITSYWEAYCEDIAAEALEHILDNANSSDDIPEEIKKMISKELKKDLNELSVWKVADDKWKQFLTDRIEKLKEERNRNLNTPKTGNIDKLFESALGLSKVSSSWRWSKKLTVKGAREKLDNFVVLRGEIAHRGKTAKSVQKSQVVDYRDFIKNLAKKTGGAVNKHVKEITGTGLW